MASSKYRVKLYGHSTEDAEAFSKSLAAVLNREPDEALTILLNVPVVVADGLEKNKAEHVATVIESIKGLCLVEPTEGDEPDTDTKERAPSGRAEPEAVSSDRVEATREQGDGASNLRQWVLIALAAGFAVFLVVAYLDTFQEVGERMTPQKPPTVTEHTEEASIRRETEPPDPSLAMEQEIWTLQNKLGVLRDRIQEQDVLVKSLYSSSSVDRQMFLAEQRRLAGMRNQFGQFTQRLSELAKRLEKNERRREQLDGKQTQ
jgi:hypothetical protein